MISRRIALIASFAGALLLAAGGARAQAATQAPDALIKQVSTEVLEAVKADKSIKAGDLQKIIALVDQKVMPYVDFQRMTASAVGRYWRQATPEQQKRLVTEFRNMLVRTYSNSISAYQGQTLKVLPSRGKQDPEQTTVRTQFVRAGGQPLPIDFTMHQKDGTWKVYDIVVEGVSLVMTYRSEFDAVVKQEGIDGLIRRLAQKNTPAAVGGSAAPKK